MGHPGLFTAIATWSNYELERRVTKFADFQNILKLVKGNWSVHVFKREKWRNNLFLLHVIYRSIMSELLQLTELDLEEKRQALSLTNVSN